MGSRHPTPQLSSFLLVPTVTPYCPALQSPGFCWWPALICDLLGRAHVPGLLLPLDTSGLYHSAPAPPSPAPWTHLSSCLVDGRLCHTPLKLNVLKKMIIPPLHAPGAASPTVCPPSRHPHYDPPQKPALSDLSSHIWAANWPSRPLSPVSCCGFTGFTELCPALGVSVLRGCLSA